MNNRLNRFFNFLLKNNKLRTFLFFLIISILLWFFSQLSKNYIYTFKIPVVYTHLPAHTYYDTSNNDTLIVKLKTSGYQLLKLKISRPVLQVNFNRRNQNQKKYKLADELTTELTHMLGAENKILTISPDTLYLKPEIYYKKKLPVCADLSIHYQQGYKNTSKPQLTPAQIWVFGDSTVLNGLTCITTEKYRFDQINSTINQKLKLKVPATIKTKISEVQLHVPVDQIIEDTLHIKLKIKQIGKKIIVFPDRVVVQYKTFMQQFDKVNKNQFKVGINFENINDTKQDTILIPKILQKPKEVFDVQIKPDKIVFLIQQL